MKNKKQKNANKQLWVESWLEEFGLIKDNAEISASQTEDGKWLCTIDLPLVNESVSVVGDTEIDAVYTASNRASKLIDEYRANHPELEIKNEFKNKRYIYETDEEGRIQSIHLDSEYRKKEGNKMIKTMQKSINSIEKAIANIRRIYGTVNGFFVQSFDRNLFKDKTEEEIYNQVHDILMDEYSIVLSTSTVIVKNDYVIAVGYANKIKFVSREELN